MNNRIVEDNTMPINQKAQKYRESSITFYLTVIITELVFLKMASLNFILCFLLSICLVYLYVIKRERILVLCFLIFANDALGQLFYTISVKYLIVLFIIFEIVIIRNVKIKGKSILKGLIGTYVIMQPFLSGLDDMNALINTLLPMILLLILYNRYCNKEQFVEEFAFGTSIVVSLLALHACITGGYSENDYFALTGYVRKGILGVGVGDANFSCLILCTGITCTINCRSFSKWIKILLSLIICMAITLTLSTTGLICLCIVLILSALINNSLNARTRNIFFILLVVCFVSIIYSPLPISMHISNIDAYVDRLQEKYMAFQFGNYADLTTGRSELGDYYWNFIKNQDIVRMMFGGNYLLQYSYFPHNTYIDFIIQFGFIGCTLLIVSAAISFLKAYHYKQYNEYRRCLITLKILYVVFSFTVSVYHGTTFVIMLFVLFIL